MNATKKKKSVTSPAILYRLLYFSFSIYPIWFLWRKKQNNHVYHWFAVVIQSLYVVDCLLHYLLLGKNTRSYPFYVMRDIVLNFTLATNATLGLLQIVVSHPRANSKDNANGILESEEDGNILCGWLVIFMTLIVRDKIKLHRQNVFKIGETAKFQLAWTDYAYLCSSVVALLSFIPLVFTTEP